jgi:hypothetical protein
MASLFPKEPALPSDDARELPPDMRQLIVDLKAEYPDFRPHEIATVCYVRFGRRPSHDTVQRVLATGPQPSIPIRAMRLLISHLPSTSDVNWGRTLFERAAQSAS